jgi:biotin transport system substrate-specific component
MSQTVTKSLEKVPVYALGALEIVGASLLLAVSAQASVLTPFLLVPFTLQTLALFLISAYLGPKKASLAVVCYMAEGAVGLPVFAQGTSGLLALIGPRAGYFAGFLASAYVVGFLTQRYRSFLGLVLSFAVGTLAIYLLGFSWLSYWIGFKQAFSVGVLPFLMGEMPLKILAAAAIVTGYRKFLID